MSKKYYRYFGGFLETQEKWLNKMADQGYRLVKAGKLLYEFERCGSQRFQYAIDFVGQKTAGSTDDYRQFLEDMGYKVFLKNINLNYSVGKVRWRPWAEKGARLATNSTTFNRELLIVEKENDGKPFELHTGYSDRIQYYAVIRNAWLWPLIVFLICSIFTRSILFGLFALVSLIPVVTYQNQIARCRNSASIQE